MSGFDRAALEEAMPALTAEEKLRSGKAADRDVYDLALAAFGSEEIASRCYCDRLHLRYLRNERPEV